VQQAQMNHRRSVGQKGANGQQIPQPLPPGTVVGCPKLRRLTLSYCKHITDRSMAHIAVHASARIEQIDLTRCTTITDMGFQHWSVYSFPRLTKLCLADCTYLTDNAIVYLTNAAKGLRELDLVSDKSQFSRLIDVIAHIWHPVSTQGFMDAQI
jgi:F-box/leucine-rich repeat protein 7